MPLDWTTQQGYDIRIRRRSGGRVETKYIVGQPRLGPDAAIEFSALWADEADGHAVDTWQVLSVTDTVLQVTYLPTRLETTTAFFWGQYVVPDRRDNPAFSTANCSTATGRSSSAGTASSSTPIR